MPTSKLILPTVITQSKFSKDSLAFIGILIVAVVHRNNKDILECGKYMRCLLCQDRFKMTLRFIRFYNKNTRAKRVQKDKVAPKRDN